MATLEEQFQEACNAGRIPGVVLVASDSTGKFKYEKAFGMKSPTDKIDVDATFIMASCTKLMTSIAALQCVERGQIGLDDDVSSVLVELKDIQILTGFNEDTGEPTFKTAEKKITLRQLITHSSGSGYEVLNPLLARWKNWQGSEAAGKEDPMLKQITVPLLFEPGTGWAYGYGLEWAGLLTMRLNNMSLEAYMQKYIWDPLGIKNITFHQELKPDVRKNLVKMTTRGDQAMMGMSSFSEDKVKWTDELLYLDPCIDEFGGSGAVGSALEYIKILNSICANDGKLLTPGMVDNMFTPQLENDSQQGLAGFIGFLGQAEMFSGQKEGTALNHGLGGLLILSDTETGIKSGTLTWSGLPNLLWTIDRKSGMSLFYAGNITPFGDHISAKMQNIFEKEMYFRAGKL